jgi:biopolymer transport protein ExbD
MNFRGSIKLNPPGFQIAPMVDIALFLLFFFLLQWKFSQTETEVDVKVPKASEGKESRRSSGEIILNIKSDGTIVMNRRSLDMDSLQESLQKISMLYPDQTVLLRGDEKTDYRFIVAVLDACRRANIWNVAFATSRKE